MKAARPVRKGADGKVLRATGVTRRRPTLLVTVSTDEDGEPFEVFGWLGKGGSFQHGVTELACRLISLHLRRGTPVEEVIEQCQGIAEMQPFFNVLPDGSSVPVLGLGDGIAHILRAHKRAGERVKEVETKAA